MKSRLSLISLTAILCACSVPPVPNNKVIVANTTFASGGSIDMQLASGGYEIRPAADDRIRVTFEGNIGDAKAVLTSNGAHAALVVRDTPHSNFKAVVEVPKAADLVIHLTAGDLLVAAIAGNKDIESAAGNVEIAAGDPNDYASVDAAAKVGNIEGGPFGEAQAGLSPHFTWSGHGKHSIHVVLGAGNLELKGK